jgi:glutathione S-transferase
MAKVDGLSLYHYEGCMWCAMVQRALAQLGIEIEQCNIYEDARHMRDLVEATGRQTVPCLRIRAAGEGREDRWMHESRDIIAYLKERFGGGD